MRGSIPGPWDHDLSQRQWLNPLSHKGAPEGSAFSRTFPASNFLRRKWKTCGIPWLTELQASSHRNSPQGS